MKIRGSIGTVAVLLALCAQSSTAGADTKKPNVVIIATGSTIAGAEVNWNKAGYVSSALTVNTMIAAVPGITDLANIKGEQISNVQPQDMSFAILLKLAKRVNDLAATDDVDGIVITHGVDTMEESAYFLNMTVKTGKPVVMAGALRPPAMLGADGPLNLYNAVSVAADPRARGRGVLVVMNERIHSANSLTKASLMAGETFTAPLRGLVGTASSGRNEYFTNPESKHTTETEFDISKVTALPRVDIIFASIDMSPDLIDSAVANGAKGIVIAGIGHGTMSKGSMAAAARAVKKGVMVVRSSQVVTGAMGRSARLKDDEHGCIASDQLSPQKARILLSLALLSKHSPDQLQDLFNTY